MKSIRSLFLTITATALALPTLAVAAVPSEYTDALDDMQTDSSTLITAAIGVLLALAAIATLGYFAIKLLKKARGAAVIVGGSLVALGSQASAAVPGAYTTALTTMQTDSTTLITAAIGVLLALAAIATLGYFAIKLLKKARGAA